MTSHRHIHRVSALLLAVAVAGPAGAQDARYDLGGGFLGGLGVEASGIYRSNYFYEPSGGLSAYGMRVRPQVSLSRSASLGEIGLDAYVDHTRYDLPGNLDEYLDYGSSGRFDWRPLAKHGFELSGGYKRGHDQPGLVRTEDGPQFGVGEVDEWDDTRVGLGYSYGSASASAGNKLSVGYRGREYVTNRAATRFLNYDVLQLGYQLSYAYSPKTSIVLTADHNSTDYEVRGTGGASRNGNEFLVRTGLRWVATGKTSGQVLVGARSYSVDGRNRPSREGFSWRADVEWVPLAATTIRVTTGQTTTETYRTDTFFIDNRSINLSWRQFWTERLSTTGRFGYLHADFVGSNRTDESLDYAFTVGYTLLRQLDLFADYAVAERDSSRANLDFNAPAARIGLSWTL